MEFERAIGGIR